MWLILIFVLVGLGLGVIMTSDARLRFKQFSRELHDADDDWPASPARDCEFDRQNELVS